VGYVFNESNKATTINYISILWIDYVYSTIRQSGTIDFDD
jgi:hypothetical protein